MTRLLGFIFGALVIYAIAYVVFSALARRGFAPLDDLARAISPGEAPAEGAT